MISPTILYTSEFRIPFLEYPSSDLEKILYQFNHQPRKKLFELGILENEKYGQSALTPLGIAIIEKIKDILREISKKYGFIEYGYVPLLDPQLFIISGRYDKFKEDMLHIRELSAVLHPTAEEWFLYLFKKNRININKAKEFLSVYHFAIFFRNTTRRKKPIRSKVFNLYSGYIIASIDKRDEIQKLLNLFFEDTWKAFGLYNNIKIAKNIDPNKVYIDYIIENEEGDDFYYVTKDGTIFLGKSNILQDLKKIRGISIGMFSEFQDLPIKYELKNYTLFAYAIGLERLLYAIYSINLQPTVSYIDLYVIPIFKIKSKEDYRFILQKLTQDFDLRDKNIIIIDDRKASVDNKIQYAKLIGSKKIIKVGKYEEIEVT